MSTEAVAAENLPESDFAADCLDEARERREKQRQKRREREEKERARARSELEAELEAKLSLSPGELEAREDNPWGSEDLYLVWNDLLWFSTRAFRNYGGIQVEMDDPDSEDHYYYSTHPITSRADIGIFLEGQHRTRGLTKEAWLRQEELKAAPASDGEEGSGEEGSGEEGSGEESSGEEGSPSKGEEQPFSPSRPALSKREHVATQLLQGLFAHHGPLSTGTSARALAADAVMGADVLIKELEDEELDEAALDATAQ